jgi:arylsulfatase A-like enzyme
MATRPRSILVVSLWLVLATALAADERPNLVFILADDLGWSDTTLYGTTEFYETPNIERLANRGILFSNAYTAHPLCSPTRSSIMTGLAPARTGFISAAGHLPGVNLEKNMLPQGPSNLKMRLARSVTRLDTKYTTLAETIQGAGYVTGHFGKWHLGHEPYTPLEHGFDTDVPHWWGPGPAGSYVAPWRFPDKLDFDPAVPNEHIEDRMATEAIAFIEKNREKPFFLNYWAFSVHGPWDGKQELIDKYAGKADPESPQRLPVYGAMVESLDDAVGRLLDTLDRLELTEKTIIVFFSDNGGNMYSQVDGITVTSNAPLRGGKATIYDGGSRVPCAVVWPGQIKPGSTSDAFLTSTDWYPTLLEMLEIKKPEGLKFDGFNQVPALLGKAGPRTSICCFVPSYFSRPGTIPSTYLRRGDWKLIRFHGDGEKGADRFELYNLKKDIGETKNLAAIKPQLVEQLNAEMDAYLLETEAIVPAANPAYDPDARPAPVRKPIDPEALFKRRDVNKDGFMTLKEYIGNPVGRNLPALTKQFNKRDANKDGKLTLAEMKGQ